MYTDGMDWQRTLKMRRGEKKWGIGTTSPGSLFLLVSPLLLFISTSDIILVSHQVGQSGDKNRLLDKNNNNSKTGIPNSFTTGRLIDWWDNKWKDDQGYILKPRIPEEEMKCFPCQCKHLTPNEDDQELQGRSRWRRFQEWLSLEDKLL